MMGTDRSNPDGSLKRSLAATTMGLIYVNPEGPGGDHDPIGAAADIRRAFGNMAMSDEETLALIAGGHTFGKAHGAHKPQDCLGAEPSARQSRSRAGLEEQMRKGQCRRHSDLGAGGCLVCFADPVHHPVYRQSAELRLGQDKEPGRCDPVDTYPNAANLVPDAHLKDVRHAPIMFTTDIALKEDPGFRKVLESWQKDPTLFAKAFARAWFKLTHRDLGPQARYLGKDIPTETYNWQDPLPRRPLRRSMMSIRQSLSPWCLHRA
jgi:catalase-peroxidase